MSAAVKSAVDALRSGNQLDRRRVINYSAVLLGLELVAFLFFIAGTHGLIVPLDKPTTTDFVSFYAAGKLAIAGTPALVYDHTAHFAAEQLATEPGIEYVLFFYPPVFLLICAVLAQLPYLVGFVFFEAATLLPYLFVARRILGEKRWDILLPLLAFPAVFWNAGIGQNSFLTAVLFGGATLLVDRRPVLAGLLFGALCYKPHFGLLVPVALAAGGHWRAFAGAALSATALVLLSVAFFGIAPWQAFFGNTGHSLAIYESGQIGFAAFVSPFGAVLMMGGSPTIAYAIQSISTLMAAALVAYVWRRVPDLPLRAATLAAATLVALPVALMYDLMLAMIAGVWFVRATEGGKFLSWEKCVLCLLFVMPAFVRNCGMAWGLPFAPLMSFGLLAVICRRIWHETVRRDTSLALLPMPRRPDTLGAG